MNVILEGIKSSGFGLVFGSSMHLITYPLEAVKLLQQNPSCQQRCDQVARDLWQKEGIRGFYNGFFPKIAEFAQKQIWCWPLMTQLPPLLERQGCSKVQRQTITGVTIATIDALTGTPFECLRINLVYKQKAKFSWHGFPTSWAKRTVGWSTFLVSQRVIADKQPRAEDGKLTLKQSLIVAVQTAALISLAVAPFDVLNTLKQAGKSFSWRDGVSAQSLRRLYRGWPLGYTGLMINNMCTILIIDRLSPKKESQL